MITAKDVFKARRYYLTHPSIKNYKSFERVYKQYQDRFPHRDLNFMSNEVRFLYYN